MIMKAQLMSKKQHTVPVLILCLAICLFCGVGATRLTPATAHQNGLDHSKVATAGPNPGVQLLGDHKNVEGAEPKPENSVNVFNRFPKGSVPPSGPSHKGYAETASHTGQVQEWVISPSTGVGHWSTNGPLNEGRHNPKDIKPNKDAVSFHKLPSGPSPGAGHKYINGHIEEIEKAQRHNYNDKVNAGNGIQRRKTMGCAEGEDGTDLYAASIDTHAIIRSCAPILNSCTIHHLCIQFRTLNDTQLNVNVKV
eukprot:Gb_21003 [translate_table: standard]